MRVLSFFKSDPTLLEELPNGGGNHTDTMFAQEPLGNLMQSDVAFGLDHGQDRLLIGIKLGTARLTLLARSRRTRRPPATMPVTRRRYPNAKPRRRLTMGLTAFYGIHNTAGFKFQVQHRLI